MIGLTGWLQLLAIKSVELLLSLVVVHYSAIVAQRGAQVDACDVAVTAEPARDGLKWHGRVRLPTRWELPSGTEGLQRVAGRGRGLVWCAGRGRRCRRHARHCLDA
eukprot:6737920-Prymnesium_polylepis.2